MNIVIKSIDEIREYENNPRFNDDAVQFVAKSIQDFGFKVPVIIDVNNIIVAGHTRVKAANKLGMTILKLSISVDRKKSDSTKLKLRQQENCNNTSV